MRIDWMKARQALCALLTLAMLCGGLTLYSTRAQAASADAEVEWNQSVMPLQQTISENTTVTVTANVTFNVINSSAVQINSGCRLTLIINSGCTLNLSGSGSLSGFAGLAVPAGAELVIDARSQGTLNASGAELGAGIGGNRQGTCGTITINGGTVNATGNNAAGIGGGSQGAGGTVIINGGTVTANGGDHSAGIGGSGGKDGGTIRITGGTVTANGGRYGGAGIGGGGGYKSGDSGGAGGNITISGDANVTATGGKGDNDGYWAGGAGIGGGGGDVAVGGAAGTISITTSGTVTATGGTAKSGNGASIGAGGGNSQSGAESIVITTHPSNTMKAVGEQASFSVAATFTGITPSYQWQHWDGANWGNVTGATAATLAFSSVGLNHRGRYRCLVGGFTYSNEAALTVQYPVPSAAVDFVNEKLTGLDTGGSYTLSNPDTSFTASATEWTISDQQMTGARNLIRVGSQDDYTADSAAKTLTIPARPAAPNVTGVNEVFQGDGGKITGTDATMEYKNDTSGWTACSASETTGLVPGAYSVRVKQAGSQFVGAEKAVSIGAGIARTYTLSVTAPTFADVTYGYVRPAVQPITISSSGDSDTTITGVISSSTDFVIGGGGDAVTAGGSISTWTVQPASGLAVGSHTATITVTYNGGATATAQVSLRVNELPVPTTWALPKTFKATKGFSYQLAKAQPYGRALPSLTYKLSNKKAKIDANGVLTAKNTGKVTVTATDASGASMKCKVTVVGNSFKRTKPLMLKGAAGLYTGTKRLYYEKGKLKAEVYVYNRTGKSIRAASAFLFELRDGGTLIYSKPIPHWQFKTKLKHKCYKVYKLTITDAMLPGVSQKTFDLGHGQVQALITGTDANGNPCVPLIAGMANVVKPKGGEAIFSPENDQPLDPNAPMELPDVFIPPTEP